MAGGPSSWRVGYRTSDMTDDGRFITFSSLSPDIVSFDMNWQSQVFRYDTVAGPTATTIVSRLPDGTPPGGSILAPSSEFLHKRNIFYATDYTCGDSMSGIASCAGPVADGAALPTSVPGRFTFDVQARDRAGNLGLISRPYYVSSGVCEPRPQGLVGWWPGDGHYRDIVAGNDGVVVNGGPLFSSGPYSMGFVFIASRYMRVPDTEALRMDDALTLSAWVYQVRDWLAPFAVIAGREGEYLLTRGPNGNVHYAIANTDPGWGWTANRGASTSTSPVSGANG